MKLKLFEVRDRATFIPVLAIQPVAEDGVENYLITQSGYGFNKQEQKEYVLLGKLRGGTLTADPYYWGANDRTMKTAHEYIIEHFDELDNGDVVDVEYILGETDEPKVPQRISSLLG